MRQYFFIWENMTVFMSAQDKTWVGQKKKTKLWTLCVLLIINVIINILYKTVLRKNARWLVKNRVSITRWKHRTSTRCWRNDGASKDNLHFDNQTFFWKVWENSQKLWKRSPFGLCSQSISHSPKLSLVFLQLDRNTAHVFYFLNVE